MTTLKRYSVCVEDVFIDQEIVIVEANSREEAEEKADELVEEGLPSEHYRRFEVRRLTDAD